jgi:hypothetical protein
MEPKDRLERRIGKIKEIKETYGFLRAQPYGLIDPSLYTFSH